jgi:hypothetical protein
MASLHDISIDALIGEAVLQTGLDDFGGNSFREGLERLLAAVQAEADMSGEAAERLLDLLRQRLVSRLEIEQYYGLHPELDTLEIGPTTSITGLPRTGTTALVNLLSLDEEFRCLRAWEQTRPVPPPSIETEQADPRRLAAVAAAEHIKRARPDLAAMHLFDPDATEEDVELLGLSFRAQQLALPIFGYHQWWRDADMRPAMAYHRRVAKLLQSQRPPNRWLFKAPSHIFFLEALFDAYPDTKVIMTHRDPARVIPSAVSLMSALRPAAPKVSLEEFARLHTEHFRIGAERMIDARRRIGEDRFLDVHHGDFVADPIATVERIYHFLGRDLRGALVDRMKDWHARNRSGAHGRHSYTAEQFGLTADGIRQAFSPYIDRFGVCPEG